MANVYLEKDSLESQPSDSAIHNYDFLVTATEMENQKSQLAFSSIAEKCAFAMILKSGIADIDKQVENLQRKEAIQDMLMKDKSIQSLKRLLESVDASTYRDTEVREFESFSLPNLRKEFENGMKSMTQKMERLYQNDQKLYMRYTYDRDRLQQYENGKNQFQQRVQEDYQENMHLARQELINAQIRIEEQQDEIAERTKQLDQLAVEFSQLEQEKHDLNELVIKVSQNLRQKDYDIKDINQKVIEEKHSLEKEVHNLSTQIRQYSAQHDKFSTFEHSVSAKESEISNLKSMLQATEHDLNFKAESINKANTVIRQLQGELEQISLENDELRGEVNQLNSRVLDLNSSLQNSQKTLHEKTVSNNAILKQEISELKDALTSYEEQYEEKYRQQKWEIENRDEKIKQIQMEKEGMKAKINDKDQIISREKDRSQSLEKECIRVEKEMKNLENFVKSESKEKDQYYEDQISHLRNLLKNKDEGDFQPSSSVGKDYIYKQFHSLLEELVSVKYEIRNVITDFDVKITPQELETQKDKSLTKIDSFIQACEQITSQLEQFGDTNQETKHMLTQMKTIIKEKDNLILAQQRAIQDLQRTFSISTNTLVKEVDSLQNQLVKPCLSHTQELSELAYHLASKKHSSDKSLNSFKEEYQKVLEIKDDISGAYHQLNGDMQGVVGEVERLENEYHSFRNRIQNALQLTQNAQACDLVAHVASLASEVGKYKGDIQKWQREAERAIQDREEEKKFLQVKVKDVQEELQNFNRRRETEEQELEEKFKQKNLKLNGKVTELENQVEETLKELSLRERQIRKLQDKADESERIKEEVLSEMEGLKSEIEGIEMVVNEKAETINNLEYQVQTKENQIVILARESEQVRYHNDSLDQENRNLQTRISDTQACLQDTNYKIGQLEQKQTEFETFKQTTKENISVLESQNISQYEELVSYREKLYNITKSNEELTQKNYELNSSCKEMGEMVEAANQEISRSQLAIQNLSQAVEEGEQSKQDLQDLKYEIQFHVSKESELQQEVDKLSGMLFKQVRDQNMQTNDDIMQDMHYLQEDLNRSMCETKSICKENDFLKDNLGRLKRELTAVKQEKRDLEYLVDQQQETVKQLKLSFTVKENMNALNQTTRTHSKQVSIASAHQSNDSSCKAVTQSNSSMMTKIMEEKDSYINKLEHEMNDMRDENERLRDQVLQSESRSFY